MAGLLDFLNLGDLGGAGGLLGGISNGIGQFGQGVQNSFDNPLMHLGLGLASGSTASEGIKNAMAAMAAKKKADDQKAIYSQFLQGLGGMQGAGGQGAPPMAPPDAGPPMAPPGAGGPPMAPPGGGGPPPLMPPPAPGPMAGPPPPGGGGMFGGMSSMVPGERPMGWDAGAGPGGPAPSPAPPAPTGPMAPAAAGPPPLTGNPSSDSLKRMIAIMAHPDLPEGPRKAVELMVGKALDDNKLTNEQKNYVAYYAQTKGTGEAPVTFDKFMAMPRHAPSVQEIYGPNGLKQKVSFNPMKPNEYTPLGGQEMAPAETKRQESVGGAQGTAQAMLPVGLENSAFALKAIDDVQGHPGKYWGTGMTALSTRIPGTKQYDFGVALDQLKGKVFGDAFDSLRGAGAITEKEGEKATVAKARLDNAQTETAFNGALQDLREVFQSGQNRMLLKAGLTRKDVAPITSQTGPKPAVPGDPGYRTTSPQQISSKAEFDALPSGRTFVAPDGSIRVKP